MSQHQGLLCLPHSIIDSLFACSRRREAPPTHVVAKISVISNSSSSSNVLQSTDIPVGFCCQIASRDFRSNPRRRAFIDCSVFLPQHDQNFRRENSFFSSHATDANDENNICLRRCLFFASRCGGRRDDDDDVEDENSSGDDEEEEFEYEEVEEICEEEDEENHNHDRQQQQQNLLQPVPSPVSHSILSAGLQQIFVDLPFAIDAFLIDDSASNSSSSSSTFILEQCTIVRSSANLFSFSNLVQQKQEEEHEQEEEREEDNQTAAGGKKKKRNNKTLTAVRIHFAVPLPLAQLQDTMRRQSQQQQQQQQQQQTSSLFLTSITLRLISQTQQQLLRQDGENNSSSRGGVALLSVHKRKQDQSKVLLREFGHLFLGGALCVASGGQQSFIRVLYSSDPIDLLDFVSSNSNNFLFEEIYEVTELEGATRPVGVIGPATRIVINSSTASVNLSSSSPTSQISNIISSPRSSNENSILPPFQLSFPKTFVGEIDSFLFAAESSSQFVGGGGGGGGGMLLSASAGMWRERVLAYLIRSLNKNQNENNCFVGKISAASFSSSTSSVSFQLANKMQQVINEHNSRPQNQQPPASPPALLILEDADAFFLARDENDLDGADSNSNENAKKSSHSSSMRKFSPALRFLEIWTLKREQQEKQRRRRRRRRNEIIRQGTNEEQREDDENNSSFLFSWTDVVLVCLVRDITVVPDEFRRQFFHPASTINFPLPTASQRAEFIESLLNYFFKSKNHNSENNSQRDDIENSSDLLFITPEQVQFARAVSIVARRTAGCCLEDLSNFSFQVAKIARENYLTSIFQNRRQNENQNEQHDEPEQEAQTMFLSEALFSAINNNKLPLPRHREEQQSTRKLAQSNNTNNNTQVANLLQNHQSNEQQQQNNNSSSNNTGIAWTDIAGLESVKQALYRKILWPMKNPKIARKFGLLSSSSSSSSNSDTSSSSSNVTGVLLHGPPGNAKTSLARALCHEGGFSAFFHMDCASVLSAFVGEAEKCIRDIFSQARRMAPAVIFFDEIESFGAKRGGRNNSGGGGGGGGAENISVRLLATLLTEMDGIVSDYENIQQQEQEQDFLIENDIDDENNSLPGGAGGGGGGGGTICVIGATNLLHLVDDALLRPGRFDLLIEIPQPSGDDREKIFQHCLEKTNRQQRLERIEREEEAAAATVELCHRRCREQQQKQNAEASSSSSSQPPPSLQPEPATTIAAGGGARSVAADDHADEQNNIFSQSNLHQQQPSLSFFSSSSSSSSGFPSFEITADVAYLANLSRGCSGAELTGAWRDGVVASIIEKVSMPSTATAAPTTANQTEEIDVTRQVASVLSRMVMKK